MNIWLPNVDAEWRDLVYPYLAFCYKMQYQKREGTGYKELQALGLNADGLVSLGILYLPSPTGSYRFVADNIMNLVKLYSIDEPEEYYTDDKLGENDYNDWFAPNVAGFGVLDTPPSNVDPFKWQVNQVVAEELESKKEGYLLNSKYFDFDMKLFNCLSEKRQDAFMREVNACKTFKLLSAPAQFSLEDYAMREIKNDIKKGTYSTQSDYLKDGFSDRIKKNGNLKRLYGAYLRP